MESFFGHRDMLMMIKRNELKWRTTQISVKLLFRKGAKQCGGQETSKENKETVLGDFDGKEDIQEAFPCPELLEVG